jgi:hypothetical protein
MMDNTWTEAQELLLYMDNDQVLYRQLQAIRKLLQKKVDKGVYDGNKAVKAFMYAVDEGAKSYWGRFGDSVDLDTPDWHRMFPKRDRLAVAQEYVKRFEDGDDV